MVTGIHHINFIVRDLDEATTRFESALGMSVTSHDELEGRGVRIARFWLGNAWLVLVQPVRDGTVPAHYLAEHGEGFFLLSLDVEDAETYPGAGPVRAGLDDWTVADLDATGTLGIQLQVASAQGSR
jgi:catechol 2,3-dioxygenase-like lactoylglutathione lyase family enzyme